MAGTLESSDVQITVSAGGNGIQIDLTSDVEKQFGDQIVSTVKAVLADYDIDQANVQIVDKGALDVVIRARATAAVERALELKSPNWEVI